MDKQLTELVEKLRNGLDSRLLSVVLYGSAARQDHHASYSDLNVLCVLREVGPVELGACEPISRWWRENGNPAPLLLSAEEVQTSTDCFPIEFQDMLESRRILHGEDVIASLHVDQRYYRAQVEHELRAKLLRLRQKAAGVLSDRKALAALMLDSVSTFMVLARHVLLLSGIRTEFRKRDVAESLPKIGVDAQPFRDLLAVRERTKQAAELDAAVLFGQYLKQVEALVRQVHGLEQQ